MTIVALIIVGLCFGSFVNALVWRLHMQSNPKARKPKGSKANLSVINGRSVCPHCHHDLSAVDLIPLFSWLLLKGKCRYCSKKIGWQYPLVELATAGLFLLSYLVWPHDFDTAGIMNFAFWLVILTGLVALTVYDLKWMLLPNKIVYPLIALALVLAVYNVVQDRASVYGLVYSVLVASGIFFLLFQVSAGKWIGGGDVKLGFLLGLLLASPFTSFLMLFAASTLGTIYSLPAVVSGKMKASARIPFGPFLIAAAVLAYLFGTGVVDWYKKNMGL